MRSMRWLVALALLTASYAVVSAAPAQASTAGNADTAMSAFVSTMWDPAVKYFYTNSDHAVHAAHAYGPNGGLYTDFWWEAQNWETVMDAYQRTNSPVYRTMIDDVYTGFTAFYPTFTNDFNDDLAWWALASIRAYNITAETKYLTTAENLFNSIYAYQDATYGGGIWWQRSVQNQKNIAANAPAAQAAAMIYTATGITSYLTDAQNLYSWAKTNLTDSAGHVYDHVNSTGLVKWDFTYNFGTYIGAADALYDATATTAYRTDAIAAADWVTAKMANGGTVNYEGVDDAGGFKMILLRNLNHLATAEGQSQYLPYLQRNTNQAWNNRRTTDNLIGPNWSAPTPTTYLQSITAAAGASALQFVTPDASTGLQPEFGTYEAENALSNGISAESTYSGYTGRGYLAGWNTEGQSVTVDVNVPSAGPYELAMRYAAAAGNASRRIQVNGVTVVTNQSFPGTASWSTWSAATMNGVTLNQGFNTITVTYLSSAGSTNYLNLDNIQVSSQLQAENGTLHSLTTESINAGYTGTGYIAGWNANGQWVDLSPNVSRTGSYEVTLRYAAAAGAASRRLYVNGANVVANLVLPGTGSWTTWNTVTIPGVNLTAGANTVSVIFDSTTGSTNYVNLDQLTLRYTG